MPFMMWEVFPQVVLYISSHILYNWVTERYGGQSGRERAGAWEVI